MRIVILALIAATLTAGCTEKITNASLDDVHEFCSKIDDFDRKCAGSTVSWSGSILEVNGSEVKIVGKTKTGNSVNFLTDILKYDSSDFVVGRMVKVEGKLARSEKMPFSVFSYKVTPASISFTSKKSIALSKVLKKECGERYNLEVEAQLCATNYSASLFYGYQDKSVYELGYDLNRCSEKVQKCKALLAQIGDAIRSEGAGSSKVAGDISPPAAPAAPASAARECTKTTIAHVGFRIEGEELSGDAVQYSNGMVQISYDTIPGLAGSRAGDAVQVCVQSRPQNCPPGDNRGIVYEVINSRTGETWVAPDSSHGCGGA